MNNQLIINTVISICVGLLGILLGLLIGKFKMAHLIADYDPSNYDKDKLCEIVSSNITLYGLLLITYLVVNYFAY